MDTHAAHSIRYLTVEATGQRAIIDSVLQSHPAFLIGGDERSHLQLTDPQVAPAHAVLTPRGEGLAIAPRYPSLSVLVNGHPIRGGVVLQPDDVVQIGSATLRFGQQVMSLPAGNLPQVRTALVAPSPSSTQSLNRLPLRPALALAAPTPAAPIPTDVYFPQQKAASSGGGLSGAFLGVLTVLGIVIALGFAIVQNTPGFLTPALAGEAANPFAFNDGNITVLMFDAEWWIYCKQQKPVVDRLAREYRGDAYVRYIDIDDPRNSGLVNTYGAFSIPLMVIMNDQGEVVYTFRGLTPEATLRAAFDAALTESTGTGATAR